MKITLRPVFNPARELDVTRSLVAAVAEALWNCYGGEDCANWVEAEMHLQRLLRPRPDAIPEVVRDSRRHDAALSRRLRAQRPAATAKGRAHPARARRPSPRRVPLHRN